MKLSLITELRRGDAIRSSLHMQPVSSVAFWKLMHERLAGFDGEALAVMPLAVRVGVHSEDKLHRSSFISSNKKARTAGCSVRPIARW